jgi:hypothetical protein
VERKSGRIRRMKRDSEIIAHNLSKAGWSWAVSQARIDAGRFIVHADQELLAFLELESAIQTDGHDHECDWTEPDEELGDYR